MCEMTLGTFYNPPVGLQPATIRSFRHAISRYARRFFFLLLKHNSLVRAYKLAIDLNTADLYADLYHCALQQHEFTLAQICLAKSKQINECHVEKEEMSRSLKDDNLDDLDDLKMSESEEEEEKEGERLINGQSVVKTKLRVISELDIEKYSKKMFENNEFLYKLSLDTF